MVFLLRNAVLRTGFSLQEALGPVQAGSGSGLQAPELAVIQPGLDRQENRTSDERATKAQIVAGKDSHQTAQEDHARGSNAHFEVLTASISGQFRVSVSGVPSSNCAIAHSWCPGSTNTQWEYSLITPISVTLNCIIFPNTRCHPEDPEQSEADEGSAIVVRCSFGRAHAPETSILRFRRRAFRKPACLKLARKVLLPRGQKPRQRQELIQECRQNASHDGFAHRSLQEH